MATDDKVVRERSKKFYESPFLEPQTNFVKPEQRQLLAAEYSAYQLGEIWRILSEMNERQKLQTSS